MTNVTAVPGHPHSEAPHSEAGAIHEQRALGFWLYLMGDAIIFALLFMTYGIMVGNTAGGPTGKQLFSLNNAALETALLLISSTLRAPVARRTADRATVSPSKERSVSAISRAAAAPRLRSSAICL